MKPAFKVIAEAMNDDIMMYCSADTNAQVIMDALAGAGYAVVPIVPTQEMMVAGDEKILGVLNDHTFALLERTPAVECWQAMIEKSAPDGDRSVGK